MKTMNDKYQIALIERLRDEKYASEYFSAAIDDFDVDSTDLGHEVDFITNVIRNLIDAHSDKMVTA